MLFATAMFTGVIFSPEPPMRAPTSLLSPLVCLLASLLAASGCRSSITGNEGNFEFSYQADDDLLDFNKPIAVGARLDLSVAQAGGGGSVNVLSASFDDPAVLDVVATSAFVVVVEAKGEGNALLSVEGRVGEAVLTDSVNLLARVPEVLTLRHTCTEASTASYLTNQSIFIPFEMGMESGQSVIGYGYYPVTVSPENALTLDLSNDRQQFLQYQTAAVAGPVTLASDIDSTTLSLNLVDLGQIDDMTDPIPVGEDGVTEGRETAFHVLPMSGGTPICQANAPMQLTTSTPATCLVIDTDLSVQGDDAFEFGWFKIRGISPGPCDFTVTFPDGAEGAGVSVDFTYDVAAAAG